MSKKTAGVGDTIEFRNTSKNASWFMWNFGDSLTSPKKDPTHIYTADDTYKVTLTVTNENDEDYIFSDSIEILDYQPFIDFTSNST